jgi:hypothetical protein
MAEIHSNADRWLIWLGMSNMTARGSEEEVAVVIDQVLEDACQETANFGLLHQRLLRSQHGTPERLLPLHIRVHVLLPLFSSPWFLRLWGIYVELCHAFQTSQKPSQLHAFGDCLSYGDNVY